MTIENDTRNSKNDLTSILQLSQAIEFPYEMENGSLLKMRGFKTKKTVHSYLPNKNILNNSAIETIVNI